MKYLFVCVSLALFAYINANPSYGGNRGGYGGGYGNDRVEYEQILVPSYGRSRGGYGGYDRPQILRSAPSGSRASAAAASAAAAVAPGSYSQYAIPRYEIDGSYNGPSHGLGGYGRGGRGGY
ncbi:chorion protein S15 [Drosophila guanche]|uniref:Blast:Chorion protein S15 n=1 Tax=Drosophila guanche TaxID=7266 RepID=A0A3B0JVI7_DROGU|nr:chorion protein S15 [Drosophila guanche]SPP77376.1 blast:Chorion protein S15 [Drosophila guanche]